jgi:hypothetical protein
MLALIRAAASYLSIPKTLCWEGIITISISGHFQTRMRIVDIYSRPTTVESQIGTRDRQPSALNFLEPTIPKLLHFALSFGNAGYELT